MRIGIRLLSTWRFQCRGFGDPLSGAIAVQQHGAVLDARDMVQKTLDLVGRQDDWRFLS